MKPTNILNASLLLCIALVSSCKDRSYNNSETESSNLFSRETFKGIMKVNEKDVAPPDNECKFSVSTGVDRIIRFSYTKDSQAEEVSFPSSKFSECPKTKRWGKDLSCMSYDTSKSIFLGTEYSIFLSQDTGEPVGYLIWEKKWANTFECSSLTLGTQPATDK